MEQPLNRTLLIIVFAAIYFLIIDKFIWIHLPLETPTADLVGNILAVITIFTLAVITAYYLSNQLNRATKQRLNIALLTIIFSVIYFKLIEKFIWNYLPIETSIGVLVWSVIVLTITILLAIVSAHSLAGAIHRQPPRKS